MAEHPTVELFRLREIGWRDWDPIGLADADCPQDEYDRYLLQAVSRLRRGEPVRAVADYLDDVASRVMGLGPSTPAARAAAERTVLHIKEYLDTLPPGALNIS